MRILFVNSVCGTGSTGRICTDLADMLAEEGHECKIAYGRGTVPEKYKKYAVKIGNGFCTKQHALRARLFDKSGLGSASATKKFISWVKKFNPDVIHLHNLHGYYINVKILFDYLKTCEKKIIWTLHDCWAFTGHCAYFSFVNCEKWETGCHHCAAKKSYPKSIFLDCSKKNYRIKKQVFCNVPNMTIVTPSQWLADLVKRSFLKEYAVQVIHNGIDLNVFHPACGDIKEQYHLPDKKIVLGVANIWDRRKGLEDMLRLADLLGQEYQVLLVGVSPQQLKELPKSVMGICRTSSATQLAGLYSVADVFVNPTYEDNYPTVNLEAQACGTYTVTYNSGGSAECIQPGCGEWVARGDVQGLANAVIRVCKEEKENKKDTFDTDFFGKEGMLNEYGLLMRQTKNESSVCV